MKPKIILGCVVDEEGRPVQGAFVRVEGSSAKDIASVTGVNGLFKMELPVGDFCIFVNTKSGQKGVKKISKYSSAKLMPTICVHY